MTTALRSARVNGVRIGAHPGFADRENFGRVRLSLPVGDIVGQVLSQTGALKEIADREDAKIAYLKLHGALANMASEDEALSHAIFAAVANRFGDLAIMALENSAQHRAAELLGLELILEAYADRAYLPGGLLVPRSVKGSVVHDPDDIVERCLRLALFGEVVAQDGSIVASRAHSICIHGDTPGALDIARAVEFALRAEGVLVSRT